MSVLIKDMEMPKSCSECKLNLRTDICKAFCEWSTEHPYSIRATDRLPDCPLSEAPESCEDAVSRRKAFEYFVSLWECIGTIMDREEWEDVCKTTVNELPSVTPKTISRSHENDAECEDAVSRADVIREISESVCDLEYDCDNRALCEVIKALPPVTPKPKVGKWIFKNDLKQYFCDQCGEPSLTDDDVYIYSMDFPNFCQNCGAKMNRGEQDGN